MIRQITFCLTFFLLPLFTLWSLTTFRVFAAEDNEAQQADQQSQQTASTTKTMEGKLVKVDEWAFYFAGVPPFNRQKIIDVSNAKERSQLNKESRLTNRLVKIDYVVEGKEPDVRYVLVGYKEISAAEVAGRASVTNAPTPKSDLAGEDTSTATATSVATETSAATAESAASLEQSVSTAPELFSYRDNEIVYFIDEVLNEIASGRFDRLANYFFNKIRYGSGMKTWRVFLRELEASRYRWAFVKFGRVRSVRLDRVSRPGIAIVEFTFNVTLAVSGAPPVSRATQSHYRWELQRDESNQIRILGMDPLPFD